MFVRVRCGRAALYSRDDTARADNLPLFTVRPHIHLPHRLREHLVHVHPVLGRGLDEGAPPDLGQGHALDGGDLALALEVHLVAHQQDGDTVRALDPHDLVPHRLNVLEGLVVGEGVHDHEPLTVLDVEVPHAGELLRPGRIKDLQHAGAVVHLDLLQYGQM